MEKIKLIVQNFNWEHLSTHPKLWAGLALSAGGLLVILGAVFNWEWLFEYNASDKWNSRSLLNLYWLQKTFGRNAARIVMGLGGVFIMIWGLTFQFTKTSL